MEKKLTVIIGLLVLALGAFALSGTIIDVAKDEADLDMPREDSPAMERVGEVMMNRNSVYLWGFDFEDRQCLWAVSILGHGGMAGLTCWERYD